MSVLGQHWEKRAHIQHVDSESELKLLLTDCGFIYNQLRHFEAVSVIRTIFTVILAFPTTYTKALITPIRR